jgi:hypothetical protein
LHDVPVLDEKPVLSRLLERGADGAPQRVRLRFHHPIAGCECPSFSLTDMDEGMSWVYAVFPDGVPNGHHFEMSKYVGFTRYELTGYFSGRMIDFYGWAAVQNDEHGGPLGGEQEGDRQDQDAEFCVEDWCYRPDPDPVLHKEIESKGEIATERAEYERILAEMRREGAKLCSTRKR